MRWLAGIMIIACSVLCGINLRNRLARRKHLLEDILKFLRKAYGAISYGSIPPDRIIRETDDGPEGVFTACKTMLDSGLCLRQSWRNACDRCSSFHFLNDEERMLAESIGGELGIYDREQQLEVLQQIADRTESFLRRVECEYRDKAKMYVTCSLLVGTLGALLII